ncbi:MAG TPA: NAD-dependent epimerase/dehydratase family protein, partial [Bacteroidota bacterium]|nr:NAD-dependent epimerase/dehydratase family protein [Bacteroidota bacterium]
LKFFNVFGPNELHKDDMASMVTKAYFQVKNTGKIRLFKSYNPNYADGEQVRDFIYVKDAIDIVWQLYENNIAGIYNIGTGKARSWNDLANAVFKAMRIQPSIEYIDMPDDIKKQYQYYTQADIRKLSATGINLHFHTLEEGVEEYLGREMKSF